MSDYKIAKGLILKFENAIKDLSKEIDSYSSEDQMWLISDNISNSAGNLVMHLIGNLNHFVGAVIGNTGYVRKRDLEFSIKDVSRATMQAEIEKAKQMLVETFQKIDDDAFHQPFPFEFPNPKFKPSTFEFMLHILGHLTYHVGQINYHRRILAK